jgi:hypothetical protein
MYVLVIRLVFLWVFTLQARLIFAEVNLIFEQKMKFRGNELVGPLLHEEEFVVPLLSKVLELVENDVIKDSEDISVFRVFSCSSKHKAKRPRRIQKLMNHHADCESPAIILSSAEGSLMMHISDVISCDNRRRLYLGVKPYTGSLYSLRYHGCVQEQGIHLIFLAVKLLDRLSYMFRHPSQHHHFVPKYLTLLGIGHYRWFNDCERILLVADGVGAAEIFQNLYERHKNTDSVYV